MKFYELFIRNGPTLHGPDMEEYKEGSWATRDEAEQAAKDAVEMAKLFRAASRHPLDIAKAQAIIERYEGGNHGQEVRDGF